MHWRTESTIHAIQTAITEIKLENGRATRDAVAIKAETTSSYITKLLKRYPEYLCDNGDGTVGIVQAIDKPINPTARQQPAYMSIGSNVPINPMRLVQTTGQYEAVLTRIAEALENSKPSAAVEPKPTRETKPTAERFGLSNPQHSAILKRTNWDAVEAKREELLGNATALELYVLWLNIGRHLRKNSAALVQMVESSLERVNHRSQ